jgi:hypothetical protein
MIVTFPRTTNINFLSANISILNLDEYFQLLAKNNMKIQIQIQRANKKAVCGT